MMVRHRPGVTFLEVIISTLIVGVLLLASLQALAVATRTSLQARTRAQASMLAHQLQSEIIQFPYADPDSVDSPITPALGLEADEQSATTRAELNDVDDFEGWHETPPRDRQGVALPDTQAWQRSVAVDYVLPNQPTQSTNSDLGVKRIRVTATGPGGIAVTTSALHTRAAPLHSLANSGVAPGSNRPPVASFQMSTSYGQSPLVVVFEGTGSQDPDGDTLNFHWQFSQGSDANGTTVTHTFVNASGQDQAYQVLLTVTDSHGASHQTTASVVVPGG